MVSETVGGASTKKNSLYALTLMHCSSVIHPQGTTYLSVFPPSSRASLELTEAREAQVPATAAKMNPDIFKFSILLSDELTVKWSTQVKLSREY